MEETILYPNNELVRTCIQHLQQELAALHGLNRSLSAVRQAVETHDIGRLPELIEKQQAGSQQLEQVRRQRQQFRTALAATLQVPDGQATIAAWAETLSTSAKHTVLKMRDEVAAIAEDTARLAQSNMAVVSHGLQILNEVRNCLTGGSDKPDRYLATGQPGPVGPQTLYKTRF
jgi:cysteinyl-tRNA synthetase